MFTRVWPINEPAASKRTEFVALNISQANRTLLFSLRSQVLERPGSIPKKPGPRKLFRCPASPGRVARNVVFPAVPGPQAQVMLCGFWKTLGLPFVMNTPVFGFGPVSIEDPSNSKSVDHPLPASTEKGNPLVQRTRPFSPQPPKTPFMILPLLPPQWRPRP